MNLRHRVPLLLAAWLGAVGAPAPAHADNANSAPAAISVRREPALLIAGQSREEFRDYLNHVVEKGAAAPRPGGAAFYTSLDSNGVFSPHANAPGDNHQDLDYLKLVQEPLVIQIGLWLSRDQLRPIAAGDYDVKIQRLHQALAELKRPVFLRIGYEFDGPHNRYPPEIFIQAYRVIARAMRANRDILLVWHSYAMLPTYQESAVADWYPGDDYVDWIGISFFQVGNEGYHRAPNRDQVLEFARAKAKPVLIAEASAIRYTRRQKTLTGQAYWDYWYAPFFALIESHPEIKAVSIINVDWDSQNQHRELEWGDCRLNSDPVVLKHWRARAAAPYWLKADGSLYDSIRTFSGQATQTKPPAQRQN
ncbi:MAG: xyl4 [Rariglobus sp.]|jgi:hypothetical protein|nr:xyl4 [Rariglobus sp.]